MSFTYIADQPLTIVATGQVTSGANAAVLAGVSPAPTGAGYMTLVNSESAGGKTIYLDGATADATKYPLLPGASVTWPLKDVTKLFAFGTGGVLGWALLQ